MATRIFSDASTKAPHKSGEGEGSRVAYEPYYSSIFSLSFVVVL